MNTSGNKHTRRVPTATTVPDAFIDPPDPFVRRPESRSPATDRRNWEQQRYLAPDIEALFREAAAASTCVPQVGRKSSPLHHRCALGGMSSSQHLPAPPEQLQSHQWLNRRLQTSSAPRSRQWTSGQQDVHPDLQHLLLQMGDNRPQQQRAATILHGRRQLQFWGSQSSPLSWSQPTQPRQETARQQQLKQFTDVQSALRAAGITRVVRSAASSPLRSSGGIGWFFKAARAHEALTGDNLAAIPPPVSPELRRDVVTSPTGGVTSSSAISSAASLLSPEVQRSVVHLPKGWDMTQLEDLTDDPALFEHLELARRRSNPSYRTRTADLHDLHIVMPIVIPSGKIVVEDVLGANYYHFRSSSDRGAHLLFGRGVSESPNKRGTPAVAPTASVNSESPPRSAGATAWVAATDADVEGAPTAASVCDVWASFLHLRLGTLYNLSPAQVGFVSDMFRTSTFDEDLCHFYVPIAIDCRGVYPSKDELLSHQRSNRHNTDKPLSGGSTRFATKERYETHGVPASPNDLARLQMLRRHVLKFASRLVEKYNFNADSTIWEKGLPQQQQQQLRRLNCPMPRIELHDNLRATTLLRGSLSIVVREWSPLTDASTFRQVWAKQYSDETDSRNAFSAEILCRILHHKRIPTARVVAGELRVEHSHLRMIDPRWPKELVPGRRIADRCADSEVPGPEESLGRFVFCGTTPLPCVEYSYCGQGDPREIAVASKLANLYCAHLANHADAGARAVPTAAPAVILAATAAPKSVSNKSPSLEEAEAKPSNEHSTINTTTFNSELAHISSKNAASYAVATTTTATTTSAARASSNVAAFDLNAPADSTASKKLQSVVSTTAGVQSRCDYSALLESETARSPDLQLCKFYLAPSGCARGFSCKFWHPADSQQESQLDVRQIVPNHPKFF